MSEKEIAGYFGATCKVRGVLTGKGDLLVDGRFEGNAKIQGRISVAEAGRVRGDLAVDSLEVSGGVEGDVHATQLVRIADGGRVDGDVRAASIAIDDGAELNGGVEMDFDMSDDELA